MPSLTDKLRALGVDVEPLEQRTEPKPSRHPIEEVVPGRFVSTPHGPVFRAEQRHVAASGHGCSSLHVSAPMATIAAWAGDERLNETSPLRFAFLDAETTGLARGAGTYAFMVGVGMYDGASFQLSQLFLRDPSEEPALLAALEDLLAPCEALVTFNGKTFDLPLLRTRYIASGQAFPFAGLPHLDLLALARRLWRSRLPSRALGCLEREVLALSRSAEDVEGWMIPELYFDYLRDGDARPLSAIFYHNAVDVLSMAALLSYAAALLADPLSSAAPAPDLADMARLFENLGHHELAGQLYRRALAGELADDVRSRVIRHWSLMAKRLDDLGTAMELWHIAASDGEIYAHVELAKAYEHRLHNYEGARFWAQLALDRISELDYPQAERPRWAEQLTHRLARLDRKTKNEG